MTWVAVGVTAAGAVAGGVSSQNAAQAQVGAANKATGLSQAAYGQSRSDMMPYMQTGLQGNELLGAYMGFDAPQLTREQIKAQLLPQYSVVRKKSKSWGDKAKEPSIAQQLTGGTARKYKTKVNVGALNKAIDAAMAKQESDYEARRANPNFGLLTKKFTNEDFVKDPGYDYRQQQGELGVNRGLATRGDYFSGAAMKELNRFNQDFASNEFGNAYNRDTAYKSNMFNRLAGMAQGGAQANQYMSGLNINNANNIGQNYMAGAQAQGAGQMGMANALAQGAGGAVNAWQNQQYLDTLNKPKSGNIT